MSGSLKDLGPVVEVASAGGAEGAEERGAVSWTDGEPAGAGAAPLLTW